MSTQTVGEYVDQHGMCAVMARVADLCLAKSEHPINRYAGCWECQVDEHWRIAANGHSKPACASGSKVEIPPFHVCVWFNGWPAGLFNAAGGTIAAGSAANEQTFLAALDAAIVKAKESPR